MKVKDLKVGAVVWLGSRNLLREGQGVRCTVYKIGRFTSTYEPCGPVIVANPDPNGITRYVLKLDEPARTVKTSYTRRYGAHSRSVCYLNSSRSKQQYLMVADGRDLMPDAEHKVMRDARADRELERDAHLERGKALAERVKLLARKALQDVDLASDEIFSVSLHEGWRNGKWVPALSFSVNDKRLNELVASKELDAALKEWHEWKRQPTPGVECAR